jgi:7-keto-8-aminopelargonate synthetase-like enzyme
MACGLLLSDRGIYIQPIRDPTMPHRLGLRTRLWLMDYPAEAFVDVRDQPKVQLQP